MMFVLRPISCLLKMATSNVKASVMDNEEVEVVTGAVDCELAEEDATDEEVMEILEQGTLCGQMARRETRRRRYGHILSGKLMKMVQ